jgi:acetate kinase
VFNAGTATLKIAVLTVSGTDVIEELREDHAWLGDAPVPEAAARMLDSFAGRLDAIGHRVVHGGIEFRLPARIDDDVEAKLEKLLPLAPLHNARALALIRLLRRAAANVPNFAVFDTAFHANRAKASTSYALPSRLVEEYEIRRYGFHGIAHQSMVESLAQASGCAVSQVTAVTLQLGSGCSACAVRNGRSVEVSMGYTPLDGLVMATRSGSVDPTVVLTLLRHGHDADEIERDLTRNSGLLALAGKSDMREIVADAAKTGSRAEFALQLFVRQIVMTVGAYFTLLDGQGALVFGGGIGTHSAEVRKRVALGLSAWNVIIDRDLNEANSPGLISAARSRQVYVARTDEEAVIARQISGAISEQTSRP